MSAGSVIVLLIVVGACVGAIIYNVKHRGACNCDGCEGCSQSVKGSHELDCKDANAKIDSFSCGACPMSGSCTHKK